MRQLTKPWRLCLAFFRLFFTLYIVTLHIVKFCFACSHFVLKRVGDNSIGSFTSDLKPNADIAQRPRISVAPIMAWID